MYVVSRYTNLADILVALKEIRLVGINYLIWKYRFGVFTRQKYISTHYHILFYAKPGGSRTFTLESRYGLIEKDTGNRSPNNADRENVWPINREYKPGNMKNKNELPLPLFTKMIRYSSNEGDRIADFFPGGFSPAKAATGFSRRVTWFEVSKPVFDAEMEELQKIRPGYRHPRLRKPLIKNPERSRTRWTEADIRNPDSEFRKFPGTRVRMKEIVAQLQEMFGR